MECESFLNDILNNNLDGLHDKSKTPTLPTGKVYRIVRRPLKESSAPKLTTKEKSQQPKNGSSIFTDAKELQDPLTEKSSYQITPAPTLNKTKPNPEIKSRVDEKNINDTENTAQRTLFTYKTWDGLNNCWRRTKIFKARSGSKTNRCDGHHYHIPLARGGELNIFPNLIETKQVNRVKKELLESTLWRKYSIQGGDEPRLHFLVRVATNGYPSSKQNRTSSSFFPLIGSHFSRRTMMLQTNLRRKHNRDIGMPRLQ